MLTVKTFARPLASHPTFTYEPSRLPRKCHVSAFNLQLALPQRPACNATRLGVANATTLDRQAVLSTQERVIRKVFEPVLTREVTEAELQAVQHGFQHFVQHYKRTYAPESPEYSKRLSNWLQGLLDNLRNYKQRCRLPLEDIPLDTVAQQFLGSECADWDDEEISQKYRLGQHARAAG